MNSDSFTKRRAYEQPAEATSTTSPTALLGEPSGLVPRTHLTNAEEDASDGDAATEPAPDPEDDGLSIAELTRELIDTFPAEQDEDAEPDALDIAVSFVELTSECDADEAHADDANQEHAGGDGDDFLGGFVLREELGGEGADDDGELVFHFGFAEALQNDADEAATEDPLDAATLFGSSGFASELPALEADDDDGEPLLDTTAFADEPNLPRRDELVLEQRIPGARAAVALSDRGDVVIVYPSRLVHCDQRLEPLWEVDVPAGVVQATWCDGQLIVLQHDGELAWLRPDRERGWQRGPRLRLRAPCSSLASAQQQLLVVTAHGRCGRVVNAEVQWLEWPDRLLCAGSGDPATLLAAGQLGPYLVYFDPAGGELRAGPPLLDDPPRGPMTLATLNTDCWLYAAGVGVWHSRGQAHAARRVPGYGQACALAAGCDAQQPAAWLALELEHGTLDVVRLPVEPQAAVIVARVELAGDEPMVDAMAWDARSERLFICSDDALLVLGRAEQAGARAPDDTDG